MKKSLLILFILFVSATALNAQKINMPADSVTNLLCKKWEMSYSMTNGKIISNTTGTSLAFLFYKDFTFQTTDNKKDITTGQWKYDPKKKSVLLLFDSKAKARISELSSMELMISFENSGNGPAMDDVRIIFKAK